MERGVRRCNARRCKLVVARTNCKDSERGLRALPHTCKAMMSAASARVVPFELRPLLALRFVCDVPVAAAVQRRLASPLARAPASTGSNALVCHPSTQRSTGVAHEEEAHADGALAEQTHAPLPERSERSYAGPRWSGGGEEGTVVKCERSTAQRCIPRLAGWLSTHLGRTRRSEGSKTTRWPLRFPAEREVQKPHNGNTPTKRLVNKTTTEIER